MELFKNEIKKTLLAISTNEKQLRIIAVKVYEKREREKNLIAFFGFGPNGKQEGFASIYLI